MQQPSEPKYVPALGYHWLTPYYDAVIGATTRERSFKQALIKQARFAPGQWVLDLACGTGTLAIWIKQHQPQANIIGVAIRLSYRLRRVKHRKLMSRYSSTTRCPITCRIRRRILIARFQACFFTTCRGKIRSAQRKSCFGFSNRVQNCMSRTGGEPATSGCGVCFC